MSVSLGFAVHFAFDLFPGGLVRLCADSGTRTWLDSGAVLLGDESHSTCSSASYLAARLVRDGLETGLLGLGLVGGFIYAARAEDALWGPLAAMVVGTALAAMPALRREKIRGVEGGRQPGMPCLSVGDRRMAWSVGTRVEPAPAR